MQTGKNKTCPCENLFPAVLRRFFLMCPCFLNRSGAKIFLKVVDLWYYAWYYISKKGSEKVANVDKIIEKMKRQPNGIRPEEVEKVLKAYGYEPVRQKGSHKHYLNKETGDLITIKQESPLKKAYIVDVLNRIGE